MRQIVGLLLVLLMAISCKKEAVVLTADEQLAHDIEVIDQYLAENKIAAMQDASGIRYVFHTRGTGPMPTKDNCIRVSYTGKILYETEEFDSSTSMKTPLTNMILAWKIIFKIIPVGSKVSMYIPSALGYGPQGYYPEIPGNAILTFDIELFDIYPYNAAGSYCN